MSDEEISNRALVPLEEKTVDFYGDEITAALVEPTPGHQEVYVLLKPICDYLGVDWSSQLKRIKRDEVLADEMISVVMMTIERGHGKGRREAACLPLEYLPGWLFGLDSSRVKPELKDKILRYRRECFKVLWKAFKEETEAISFSHWKRPASERKPNPVLKQIREQALAMAKLAEEQMEIEAKALEALDQAYYAHNRLDEFYQFVSGLDIKVGEIEQIVRPGATISEAQASVIVNTVKALAQYLTTKEPGKNHYQGIFGELYRLFQVGEYRRIRQADYPAVLAFLDEWYRKAGGSGIHTQSLLPLDPEPKT